MLAYLFKRLLLFIPTLLLITLVAFGLSRMVPGDELNSRKAQEGVEIKPGTSPEQVAITNRRVAERYQLNLPPFYFAIQPAVYPDTLHRIIDTEQRGVMRELTDQYGNWTAVAQYFAQLDRTEQLYFSAADSIKNSSAALEINRIVNQLKITASPARINSLLRQLPALPAESRLGEATISLQKNFQYLVEHANQSSLWVPSFRWYGFNNRYHRWLSGLLVGDLGASYVDNRPVHTKIGEAIGWTLRLSIVAIILAFVISVPLGVWLADRADTRWDRWISVGLFGLYSLPVFWIGTLLLVFFTTSEYGMDWFHGIFPADYEGGWWGGWKYLFLPILCLVYPALAFLTRQMRGSTLEVLRQQYITTAASMGFSRRFILTKYALRNALFPVITLIANVFPATVAGSIVVEVIYNIPGMGRLTIQSILADDWPTVFGILLLGALLTLIGMLVADLLYAWADPRVRLTKSES